MKIKQLFITIIAFMYLTAYGQEKDMLLCFGSDPNNNLYNIDGFTVGTNYIAQTYYWEICSGYNTVFIDGSNTNRTVRLWGTHEPTHFIIKVSMVLYDGTQKELCNTVKYDATDNYFCEIYSSYNPITINYDISEEYEGDFFGETSDFDYIEWSWAIYGYVGGPLIDTTPEDPITLEGIYDAASNLCDNNCESEYNLVILAHIVNVYGGICDVWFYDYTIECADICGNPPIKKSISILPNPSNGTFTIQTDKKPILKTIIYNLHDEPIKSILDKNLNKIDLSNHNDGLYFVRVIFKDGTIETKKIILNK